MGLPTEGRREGTDPVSICILAAVLSMAPALSACGASPSVWPLSSWQRSLRSDPPGPRKAVQLFVAGNEWESFQIAVRGEAAATIARVDITPLVAESGVEFPAGRFRVYRAYQLRLKRPTYRNADFREDWYPDALIPATSPEAPAGSPAPALRALPFELPPGETHTFWIDVHVPEGTAAEAYRGAAEVSFEGGARSDVPIELRVWPFALPRRASLKTEFGSPAPRILGWSREQVRAGRLASEPDPSRLEEACAILATDHRLNAYPPPGLMSVRPDSGGAFELSPEQVAGWKDFLSRHHANAVAVPPPHRYFMDPTADRLKIERYLKSWDRALAEIGASDLLCYSYLIDEPNDADAYRFTQAWGRRIRACGSRVKVLVTEQTRTQDPSWGDLHGAVDIWVPLFSLFDAETAAARREEGEEIWTYTALCQGEPTPWWHIDYPLIHYRIAAWIAWSHHMTGLLYWGGLSHWKDVEDPWTDPETYRVKDGGNELVFNGEGSLVYPGAPCGLEGPVPSMRLKAIRDGIEDFEYLALLEGRGRRPLGEAVVQALAPSWNDWSRDAEQCFQYRRRLGCLVSDALRVPGAPN